MIATDELIGPAELSESNLLETTRTILKVVHNIADKYPTHDMELMERLVEGQEGVESRLEGVENRLDRVEASVEKLNSDNEVRSERLEKKLENQLNRQTDLLRMIAENTKRA